MSRDALLAALESAEVADEAAKICRRCAEVSTKVWEAQHLHGPDRNGEVLRNRSRSRSHNRSRTHSGSSRDHSRQHGRPFLENQVHFTSTINIYGRPFLENQVLARSGRPFSENQVLARRGWRIPREEDLFGSDSGDEHPR